MANRIKDWKDILLQNDNTKLNYPFVDMDIKTLKRRLNLSNEDISKMFGMSYNAYANSSAKERYESALCRFYECVLIGGKKEN
jgi:hypothetical protein